MTADRSRPAEGLLVPDHKTSLTSKDNGRALRQVCLRFVALCRQMGLLAGGTVVVDEEQVQVGELHPSPTPDGPSCPQIEQSIARYLARQHDACRVRTE